MANELPKYVFHEEFGEGETINGMYELDEEGDVVSADIMFEHGIEKDVPADELMVLEGRGRPKGSKNKPKGEGVKPKMPSTRTPSNSEDDDDSDGPSGPGIHGELLRHQDLGDLKNHEIEFHDGKKVKVSPSQRNKALTHIKSMMGPGKNPDTRMAALRKLGSNHETFKKMIGEEVELDEAVPYTLGGKIDKENTYKVHRQDWKGNWSHNPGDVYHSLSDAQTVARNMKKGASSTVKTKITKHARTKLAGPKGVLPEDVEQVDEKLIGKQKKLDKNHNGKLDSQDFKMLRKESAEPKVSVYTEANRFRSVENAVKEIMLNNTNLRQLAKEEEFKRNNPGRFEK